MNIYEAKSIILKSLKECDGCGGMIGGAVDAGAGSVNVSSGIKSVESPKSKPMLKKDVETRHGKKDSVLKEGSDKKWIQKAVSENPGALTKQAKAEGGMSGDKISKAWLNKKAKDPDTSGTTKKRIALAKTLSKMKK